MLYDLRILEPGRLLPGFTNKYQAIRGGVNGDVWRGDGAVNFLHSPQMLSSYRSPKQPHYKENQTERGVIALEAWTQHKEKRVASHTGGDGFADAYIYLSVFFLRRKTVGRSPFLSCSGFTQQ